MRAAYYETPGPPEVLTVGDLPTPEPKPGQVRIKVGASSVNPIDVYFRSGMVAVPNRPTPTIPGCDFAGTVDAVGDGVTKFRVGDRVWGTNQGLLGRQGTFAEFACVDEAWVYALPATVSEADAAAAALVGMTAYIGLFGRAKLKAGETVFVNGGTGGVGAMVVQMAKAAGARVICTAGGTEKTARAKALGADVAIDYKAENVPAAVKAATAGKGIDVWYETLPPGDFDATVDLMAANGRVVVMAGRAARPVLPNGPFYVKGLSLVGFAMFNIPAAEQAEYAPAISRWLADGAVKAVIGKAFPLSDAAAAHALQEANTLHKAGTLFGKIVVTPG